jgi:hypothetical protein
MRRGLAVIAVVLSGALGLTGCGGSSGPSFRKFQRILPTFAEDKATLEGLAKTVMVEHGAPAKKVRCVEQNIAAKNPLRLARREDGLGKPGSETFVSFLGSFARGCP